MGRLLREASIFRNEWNEPAQYGSVEHSVSIIIPAYYPEHLDAVIEHLERIGGFDEIIIVDDASTDNSREIINGYKDSRIKTVFLEQNRHICYAGNVGFQMALGKYVALIGHDDIWKEDKLEKQISFLEEHPTHTVCFTWVDMVDEFKNNVNDNFEELNYAFCGNNHSKNHWLRKFLISGNQFCAPSACIRRCSYPTPCTWVGHLRQY